MSVINRTIEFIGDNPLCTVPEIYEGVTGQSWPTDYEGADRASAHVHNLLTRVRSNLRGSKRALQGTYVYDSEGVKAGLHKHYRIESRWIERAVGGADNFGRASFIELMDSVQTYLANMYQHVVAAKTTRQGKRVADELAEIDYDFESISVRLNAIQRVLAEAKA